MSLDVYLTALRPTQVLQLNITHNLNTMASNVLLKNGQTLYQVLRRPDEHGYTKASQIAPLLLEGLEILRMERARFIPYNPSNGWGNYTHLVEFV